MERTDSSTNVVLFDMDGVLVDSEPYWQEFWTEEIFPQTATGNPTLTEVTGRNFRETLVSLDQKYGLPGGPQRFEARAERFAEDVYGDEVTVTDGFHGLVTRLREADLAVGIVSSSPRPWIRAVVDGADLGPFDVLVSADELDDPGKPEPHVYRSAAEAVGSDPTSCLVVEDSVNGVRSAHRAGATVVRYCCDHPADPLAEADAVAADVAELRDELGRRLGLSMA